MGKQQQQQQQQQQSYNKNNNYNKRVPILVQVQKTNVADTETRIPFASSSFGPHNHGIAVRMVS